MARIEWRNGNDEYGRVTNKMDNTVAGYYNVAMAGK